MNSNRKLSTLLLGLGVHMMSADAAMAGGSAPTPNATPAETPVPAGKFRWPFNFKTKKEAEFTELLSQYPEAEQATIAAQFDEVYKNHKTEKNPDGSPLKVLAGYKRKSVTFDLDLPAHVQAPDFDSLTADLVKSLVADFVKAEYIDNFAPVGQHDWAHIREKMAEVTRRGGSLKLDIPDEVWTAAAASFGEYITTSTGKAVVGDRMKAAFKGKFAITALSRHLNDTSSEIIAKIKQRLEDWAMWVAENDSDNTEDYAKLYEYLADKLEALDQKQKINFLDVL
jgi:hypothetical protein